jgi:hypothetical protein
VNRFDASGFSTAIKATSNLNHQTKKPALMEPAFSMQKGLIN